jgi:glucoamylase
VHHNHRRSGKDINTILASIHNFDPSLGCDAATFQPCSDRALANHKAVTDSFRSSIYPINKGARKGQAVAVGRYPEDVYYDGNPWYLATSAAAEQLYDAMMTWEQGGGVTVTDVSLAFFRDLVPDVAVGVHEVGSPTYARIMAATIAYADGFMDVVRRYTPLNGTMSEQFGKESGEPLSAHDLTWSYASFLTAVTRRAKILPRSWASSAATEMPRSCTPRTMQGHYVAPSQTTFPHPSPSRSAQQPEHTAAPCPQAPSVVPVEFHELVETRWGDSIRIVGNVDALGAWNVDDALMLHAADYTAGYPVWKVRTDLPWGRMIQYKFVKVDSAGRVTWEGGPNHMLVIPEASCPVTTGLVEDRWRA